MEALSSNFHCSELAWVVCTELPSQQIDVIVASDVVYDPTLYEPLRDTLLSLLDGINTCLMAHRHRHPNDKVFFSLLNDSGLVVTEVSYDVDRDVHILTISK